MRTVRWFKCPVIGTGKVTEEKDDAYRPVIADLLLEHYGWSAVYYPSRPPYKFCVVRAVIEHDVPAPSQAREFDVKGMKKFCDKFPYFKQRWLDQPAYPVRVVGKSAEGDPVETRYFRSDSHTINTKTHEKLLTTNTTTYKEKTRSVTDFSGILYGATANFITEQLGASKLNATTWTFYLWGRISTLVNIDRYDMLCAIYKVESDGTQTTIGFSDHSTPFGTSFSQESASFVCPETALASTDAIKIIGYHYVWTTNSATFTIYFRCGDGTYNSRITNFSWFAPTAWKVTVAEKLGMVDAVAKVRGVHVIVAEKLGLVDAVSKRADYKKTADEKLGMVDGVVKKKHSFVTAAEKLGMVDAVAKKKAMYVAVAEKLGLKDDVSKRADYKQSVAEKLGLLDAVQRSKGIYVTVAEKLGMLDSVLCVKNPTILAKLIKKYIQLESVGGEKD